jgi:hypothetical protein
MVIRRLVFAGLVAALAMAGIGIVVMSGSGAGPVTPPAHIVSQGAAVVTGPVIGPPG